MSRHPFASLVSPETRKAHRATWYVYAWDGQGHVERLRHTSTMRGLWGHDVECSCGWQSRTGGGTRTHVEDRLWQHRLDEQYKREEAEVVAYAEKVGISYASHWPAPSSFKDAVTCGTCHRTWDDAVVTSVTPAPSARCPFEAWHS